MEIEKEMGRVRDMRNKFAPRCIDLDVSFYGSTKGTIWLDVEDMRRFAHVVVPISDIKPDLRINNTSGESVLSLAQKLTKLNNPSDYFPLIEKPLGRPWMFANFTINS